MEELNIADVRKVLEDADLYEPDMPENVMISFYKAVTDSKNTASEENETRRLNDSQSDLLKILDEDNSLNNTPVPVKNKVKPSFTPRNWTSEKKVTTAEVSERNNNENKEDSILEELLDDSPKDATKETFGFNEMANDADKALSIISHKIKFIPIQNSQQFLNSTLTQKAKMLYLYHTKLNKMKTHLARMSFYPAPLPKITSFAETFPSSSDDVDFQETYICRSGRQTKRKVYNYDEDDDSLDSASHKKTKNSEEEEWLCKPGSQKGYLRSKKSDTNHAPKADSSEVETDETISASSTTTNEAKPLSKPESRPSLLKKLSNEDIMKRSRFFSDTPKRRCELLFDNLKNEEEKRQREEKAMEAFNRTLEGVDDGENDTVDEDVIAVEDEVLNRRVVPPLPRRRPINRKRSLTPLNVSVSSSAQKKDTLTKKSSSSSSNQDEENVAPKTNARKRLNLRKNGTEDNGLETLPSTSQPSKDTEVSSVICPICNGSFREDKIVEHASSCGDEPVTRSMSKISRITCEICDAVVPADTDFDTHLKECAANRNGGL